LVVIADFVCFETRLIVEADGSQHGESASDISRDAWFAAQGFRIRRFWNADILHRREEVAETLWHDLSDPPHPSPLERGHLLPRGEKEGCPRGEGGSSIGAAGVEHEDPDRRREIGGAARGVD
jgi:hypothetical protein